MTEIQLDAVSPPYRSPMDAELMASKISVLREQRLPQSTTLLGPDVRPGKAKRKAMTAEFRGRDRIPSNGRLSVV